MIATLLPFAPVPLVLVVVDGLLSDPAVVVVVPVLVLIAAVLVVVVPPPLIDVVEVAVERKARVRLTTSDA